MVASSAVLRIAHVSDLHVLSPLGVEWRRVLFNKRMAGYANVLLSRGRVYRREYLAAARTAVAKWADHVVVTGDITDLSLEVFCASGASLDHRDERVRADFNLYTTQNDGEVSSSEAWVLDPATLALVRRELPVAAGAA